MSKRRVTALDNIYKRDSGICHYCKDPVFLPPSGGGRMSNHPKRASRDHIVPRYWGGESHPRNYVLACAECNSGRNHDLFVCDCTRCSRVLNEFKRTDSFFEQMIVEIAKFNKPIIKRYKNTWYVYVNDTKQAFTCWTDALTYAMNYERILS